MHHSNTLELTQAALAIIDMQEAFRLRIANFDASSARIAMMTKAATLLNIPIVVTEQYPKGLGHTAPLIKEVLPQNTQIIEKTTFSSCGAQEFCSKLESARVKQILVCGIEAHICVNQTVHDLLASGYQVHLLTDCISSRNKRDRRAGLEKMQMSGAIPSSVEMALFEMMRDAKHEQFKAIQGLVK
jgi:nicotinamidase-related amidase